MSALFSKLDLSNQHPIVVTAAPRSFDQELGSLEVTVLHDFEDADTAGFVIGSGTTLEQVEALAAAVAAKTEGDAVVWFACPKTASKRYRCEFDRDTGWAGPGEAGFEPVRQVAVDEDWPALRFRRVEYIEKLTRSTKEAISGEGTQRTTGG
jgi:hypothetical protein